MAQAAHHPLRCDVLIAGGGMVGASLALAVSQLGLDAVLVEASEQTTRDHPSFDERTTALSNGSRRIFEGLGVWAEMEREATPIRRIHVSDRGRFGFARIDASEQGLPALGHVAVNRVIGTALWRALKTSTVQLVAPATVSSTQLSESHRSVYCTSPAGEQFVIAARLVVAADGARSLLRDAAGIDAQHWDYDQVALVTNVLPQRFHDYVAYERFTPDGPLALLPLSEGRMGLVWTVARDKVDALAHLTDAEFLRRLQDTFGFRLGRFTKAGARHTYPLALTRAAEHVAPRLAVIGNAAQALHPIAGQGFNLGLRDAASLAEVLADALLEGGAQTDVGDGIWLQRYRAWRGDDRARIVQFTDGLVRLFGQSFGPIKLLRDMGLLAFDLMPPAKGLLSQLSLGAAGRIPRLARGLALRAAR